MSQFFDSLIRYTQLIINKINNQHDESFNVCLRVCVSCIKIKNAVFALHSLSLKSKSARKGRGTKKLKIKKIVPFEILMTLNDFLFILVEIPFNEIIIKISKEMRKTVTVSGLHGFRIDYLLFGTLLQ